MKRYTAALILLAALICSALCSCGIVKSPDKYSLSDKDSVTSVTKVVGARDVKSVQISKQYVKYKYKNINNSKDDVEKYAYYLVNTENFTPDKKYINIPLSSLNTPYIPLAPELLKNLYRRGPPYHH